MEQEITKKFGDMTNKFREQSNDLAKDIRSACWSNIECALKNYKELQSSYVGGFAGITGGAKKANTQLLTSMDKNYAELKEQMKTSLATTKKKANETMDGSLKDYKTQCEQCLKKAPFLPDETWKSVLGYVEGMKGELNKDIEIKCQDILDKIEKNYQETRQQLTLPELKEPKVPALDINADLINKAVGRALVVGSASSNMSAEAAASEQMMSSANLA